MSVSFWPFSASSWLEAFPDARHEGSPSRATRPRRARTGPASPASPSPRLEIASLGRRERREQAAVGLEVDERRAIEAVETPDQQRRPSRSTRSRAPCRSGSDEPASAAQTCRASSRHWPGSAARDRGATREANRGPRSAQRLDPVERRTQGSSTSMRQIGPSARPWRGHSSREVHGVRMTPMKVSAGVERRRRFDRDLVQPDFVQPHHWAASRVIHGPRARRGRARRFAAPSSIARRTARGVILSTSGACGFWPL